MANTNTANLEIRVNMSEWSYHTKTNNISIILSKYANKWGSIRWQLFGHLINVFKYCACHSSTKQLDDGIAHC